MTEMATAALVSIEGYLNTTYEPDCEYVDGQLVERSVGEHKHSFLQGIIFLMLKAQKLRVYVEHPLQVSLSRFRIPDVLALSPGRKPTARYEIEAPYIVVEVLSPEDRIASLSEKLQDYFTMQIPNIWVVDPEFPTLTVHQPRESHTFTGRVTTSDGKFTLDLEDIFRLLAEDEAGTE